MNGKVRLLATPLAVVVIIAMPIDILTRPFPGGEIRGQLQVVPEPASLLLLGTSLLALATGIGRHRRRSQSPH